MREGSLNTMLGGKQGNWILQYHVPPLLGYTNLLPDSYEIQKPQNMRSHSHTLNYTLLQNTKVNCLKMQILGES